MDTVTSRDYSFELRQDEYMENRRFISENSTAASCLKIIDDYLLSRPINIMWGTVVMKPTTQFLNILNKHWTKFVRDVMREIVCRGIVPVAFVTLPDGVNIVPVVPEEPHKIRMVLNNKTRSMDLRYFRLYSTKRMKLINDKKKYDKKVKIFNGFGWDPHPDGSLSTPITQLTRDSKLVNQISDVSCALELKKLNPDVIAESTLNSGTRLFMEASTASFGDRTIPESIRGETINISKGDLAQYMNEFHSFEESKKKAIRAANREYDSDGRGPTTAKNSITIIPDGYKYSSQVGYTTSNQWKERSDKLADDVCAIFGFPRNLVHDSQKMSYSGIEAGLQLLNKSLLRWKTRLGDILTDVYECIYGESDCTYISDVIKAKGMNFSTKFEDFKEIADETKVVVSLGIVVLENIKDLNKYYALGMINWETYYRIAMASSNIDIIMHGFVPVPIEPSKEEFLSIMQNEKKESQSETAGATIYSKKRKTTDDDEE